MSTSFLAALLFLASDVVRKSDGRGLLSLDFHKNSCQALMSVACFHSTAVAFNLEIVLIAEA